MTHRHGQVPIRVFQPGRRGKKRREVTPRGPRRVSTEAGAGLRHAPEAGGGPPACRRLTEEKADVAGGAARPGGKSVSPKCARRLPPASFGGLPPVVAAPPRPGGPRKILAVDRAAPGKGQRMSPRPLSTTRDITREHLGTQSGRSHRRFGLHPSLPAAGRQLRGGEGRTAQEAVAAGPRCGGGRASGGSHFGCPC